MNTNDYYLRAFLLAAKTPAEKIAELLHDDTSMTGSYHMLAYHDALVQNRFNTTNFAFISSSSGRRTYNTVNTMSPGEIEETPEDIPFVQRVKRIIRRWKLRRALVKECRSKHGHKRDYI